jgi:hypothetical protein
MARFARGLLVAAAIGGLGVACNTILGSGEPIVDLDGGGADGFEAPNCGDASVIDDGPLYVLEAGEDTATCGTQDTPCKSIAHAMDLASAIGKTVIRVGQGEYREQLVLRSGFTIEGGWIALTKSGGHVWYVDCRGQPIASQQATLLAPDEVDVAVIAKNLEKPAVVSTMTVKTKEKGKDGLLSQPGETLYGVKALGETTRLTLSDVYVVAGEGGRGGDGVPGGLGPAASGDCEPQSGEPGGSGGAGDHGKLSELDSNGVVTHAGETGALGAPGKNGAPPAAPKCETGCCHSSVGNCGTTDPSCGKAGGAGCGGGGGFGGTGGQGGGSSVGLFVADAQVTVIRGELRADKGGAGGNGGPGGGGGAGATGSKGDPGPVCPTSCPLGLGCSNEKSGPGGEGSVGGTGGPGGQGGGGAGGSTYGYVAVGKGGVLTDNTAIPIGTPGLPGAPNGLPGVAKESF